MRLKLTIALAVAASLAALTAFTPGEDGYPPIVKSKTLYAKNDLRGQKAPKMEFGDLLTEGKIDTKGKVVLVDFWATWCPPCREGIPKLNKWAEKFKDDLVIVGVSNEDSDTIKKFMEGTAMKYHVTTDQMSTMSKVVGVEGIPHVLVVSADGIVRWQGFPELAEDKLTEDKLAQIIAQSKKDYKASIGN